MIETRALHVMVSSDHSSADLQVADAIARVISRYAVDLTPGLRLTMPHDGVDVTYLAKAAINLGSVVRAARAPSPSICPPLLARR
jgi:hypothetical protein